MEIAATTLNKLHLFLNDQRFKSKGVRFNISDEFSLLPINLKLDLDNLQVLSRTGRDGKEKFEVVVAPKKRQRSDEGKPPVKKQKKAVKEDSTTKARSNSTLTPNLNKSVSKLETNTKVTKPEKSVTVSKVVTKTKADDGIDLKSLIAKAQQKIQEKRHIDHRREHIATQRIAARIALNQMVATVCFDDHLNYLRGLEQRGYPFIHDEVDCLNMFSLLSRSDYNGITNSVFRENKTPWCDDDSRRKKAEINKRKKH